METQENQGWPTFRFGRYRLLDELGEGGMATVYRALMEGPGGFSKKVALKVVHTELARNREYTAQFISEARLGGFLSHPNLVEILDFGNERGRPFLAMELVEGPTLAQLLRHQRTIGQSFPVEVALELVIQACRGLAYAHRATDHEKRPLKLVHRDLKPSNFLVTIHGAVKIADFGVARAETNLNRTVSTGFIKGTISYMSPEQARGDGVCQQSDIFAMGLVLAELLTQETVYNGRTIEAALRQAQDVSVGLTLERLPECPIRDELRAVLLKAWALEATNRYATADLFADALEELRQALLPGVTVQSLMTSLGEDWRSLPGIDAMPARILLPPITSFGSPEPEVTSTATASSHALETSFQAEITARRGGFTQSLPVDRTESYSPPLPPGQESETTGAELTPSVLTEADMSATLPRAVGAPRNHPISLKVASGIGAGLVLLGILLLALYFFGKGEETVVIVAPVMGGAKTPPPDMRAMLEGTPRPAAPTAIPSRPTPPLPQATPIPVKPSPPPIRLTTRGSGTTPVKPPPAVTPSPKESPKGLLSLNSSPPSKLRLDGATLSGFPVKSLPVKEGEHTVIFTSETGQQLLQRVWIDAGSHQICTAFFAEGKVECRVRGG